MGYLLQLLQTPRCPQERGRPAQKPPHTTCDALAHQRPLLRQIQTSSGGSHLVSPSLPKSHHSLAYAAAGRGKDVHSTLPCCLPSGIYGPMSLAAHLSIRSAPDDIAQQASRPSHPGSPDRASKGTGRWVPSPANYVAEGLTHLLILQMFIGFTYMAGMQRFRALPLPTEAIAWWEDRQGNVKTRDISAVVDRRRVWGSVGSRKTPRETDN